MRASSGRGSVWSQFGRAGIAALSLAFAQGCADIWGFDDLTSSPDGGADATSHGPDTGGGDDGTAGDGGAAGEGGAKGGPEAGSPCAPPGTILSCGGCNHACDTTQSNVTACQQPPDGGAGSLTCVYRGCAVGWQDCDKTPPNTAGCESSTTSTTNCGACGNACDTAHSIGATCVASADGGIACQYSGCQSGWADCDPSAPDLDGCETSLATAANCGACGRACDKTTSQGATCKDGTTCSYTGCSPGFADCNTTPPDIDGCEKPTMAAACAACGGTCDTTHSVGAACDTDGGTTCRYTGCAMGFANCNTTPPDTNGCETPTTTATNCGVCGRSCDTKTSTGATCTGTNCTYGGCAPGFANCDTTAGDTNGCESSLSSTATCGGCKNAACNTKTGAASCNGTTCSYKCNTGLIDCNAGTPPDSDGCECATSPANPACCNGACQTVHSNGVGQSFFDCNPPKTFTAAQAQEACERYAGVGACSSSQVCCAIGLGGLCLLGSTATSVCGAAQGQCRCWQWGGPAPGTVQTVSGKCTAACGATSDPAWN